MQGRRDVVDWALFVALSFLWASAFSFTKLAVADLPPRLVIVLRLHLGAAILLGALYVSGGALPSLRDRRRWASMVSMGLVGMTVPFLLVTIGQQTVPSSLASLYVAAAPLITICGVHLFFHDEKLTLRAAMGVAIGFIGVGILLGPSIFNTTDSGGVWAQILCLLGATGYAASNLI
ncbi:MAG: EamA family transporter, partial [Pseudomonadota bacterium]